LLGTGNEGLQAILLQQIHIKGESRSTIPSEYSRSHSIPLKDAQDKELLQFYQEHILNYPAKKAQGQEDLAHQAASVSLLLHFHHQRLQGQEAHPRLKGTTEKETE
jgi:hypothetical protein